MGTWVGTGVGGWVVGCSVGTELGYGVGGVVVGEPVGFGDGGNVVGASVKRTSAYVLIYIVTLSLLRALARLTPRQAHLHVLSKDMYKYK